jgi:hypothetical protein
MPRKDGDPLSYDPVGEEDSTEAEGLSAVPEAIRRMATLGLSGFFSTESALRKALGDTVPKDWVDFAADQGDRTREELLERITGEFGRVVENLEFAELLAELMEGRTIEIEAKIKLGPKVSDSEAAKAPKPATRNPKPE